MVSILVKSHSMEPNLITSRRFYLIWMIITLAWIPMVWAFVPETVSRCWSIGWQEYANTPMKAGRSLEQMDYFFKKYQDKWYIRDVAYEWVEREDVMTDHADDKEAALEIEHPVKVDSPSIDGNRAVV